MVPAEVVLFDFGGTLDADGIHWSPRFHAAYRAAGGTLEFAAFEPRFKAADLALASVPGISTLGFHATIEIQTRLLVERLPDRDRVDAAALAERFHADATAAVRRNVPILERLARRHRLGIVSNYTGNLVPCLEELGLARLFAAVSDSGRVGWTKPDPRIFWHALSALRATPHQAWMVGDNFETDIRAAAGLGMRTCWLTPPARPAPSGLTPTARIGRFAEIERVLA
ncbi:MAG TPA: HAD family hydrolase [Gemmatimonadales bacterium]|nr:HAD family hydrolase [Gemmatimonadales bacterium]